MNEKDIPYHLLTCPHCAQSASYQFVLPAASIYPICCRFCHQHFGVKTNMHNQIERIIKSSELNNGGNKMKVCPKCGKELKDEAKFCGGCGYKFPVAAEPTSQESTCPSCGNPLKPGAKFCGKCGASVDIKQVSKDASIDITKQASYIQWNVLPGQLALKIDSAEIASYGRVKGIVVQEGVRALIFVNGKIISELGAGSYEFKTFPNVKTDADKEEKKQGFISSFINNVRNFFRNAPQLPANVQNVSVVLIRSVEFPLVFEVKNVATSGIRSNIGLHILCKISNVNDFYTHALLDQKYVSFESVKNALEPAISGILNNALSAFTPDKVAAAQETVLSSLQTQIAQVYSYFSVTKIVNLTADNEELENIRRMQEDLYISELELTELTKRNSFLNRLQDENNAQALREARSQVDFEAAMDKIDQDRELNEDERLKFSQMLEAQRMIREAKTQDEVDAALQVFRKSEMFREEELDNIQAQINQNAALRDLSFEQALNLATLANEKEIDRQQLQWEIEIGNKRFENEIARQRMQDDYTDERRQKDAEFEDSRRRSQIDLDKEEMNAQMELFRQMQQIKMQEKQQQIDADKDMAKIYAGMTAEQIVAANPNITPQAAAAMAEKFKADAIAAQNDKTAQMAMQQNADMQAFMKEQMAMMRDMAIAGMGVNQANQQQMMNAKNEEMNRFANGVNNAVSSVSGALKNPTTVVQNGTATAPAQVDSGAKAANICPSCGTPHEPGALFCENCGGSL